MQACATLAILGIMAETCGWYLDNIKFSYTYQSYPVVTEWRHRGVDFKGGELIPGGYAIDREIHLLFPPDVVGLGFSFSHTDAAAHNQITDYQVVIRGEPLHDHARQETGDIESQKLLLIGYMDNERNDPSSNIVQKTFSVRGQSETLAVYGDVLIQKVTIKSSTPFGRLSGLRVYTRRNDSPFVYDHQEGTQQAHNRRRNSQDTNEPTAGRARQSYPRYDKPIMPTVDVESGNRFHSNLKHQVMWTGESSSNTYKFLGMSFYGGKPIWHQETDHSGSDSKPNRYYFRDQVHISPSSAVSRMALQFELGMEAAPGQPLQYELKINGYAHGIFSSRFVLVQAHSGFFINEIVVTRRSDYFVVVQCEFE